MASDKLITIKVDPVELERVIALAKGHGVQFTVKAGEK